MQAIEQAKHMAVIINDMMKNKNNNFIKMTRKKELCMHEKLLIMIPLELNNVYQVS